VHYIPVYRHPYYRERFADSAAACPNAEAAFERLITLPLFPAMTDSDAHDVVHAMNKVVNHYRR
jgi:perosamine synthetase